MHLLLICVMGFIAMVVQDVIGTAQTQAAARNRATLTGLLDVFGWLVTISTTTIGVNALDSRDLVAKAVIISVISAANFIGSAGGVKIGARFIK
jgi:hypothetical protein